VSNRIRIPAIAMACLTLGFVVLVSTGQDDPYLTFWPAYTLANFGEIANYNGDRIEQSSSLLHTLSLAAIIRTTSSSVPAAGYWLGVIASLLALLRAASLSRVLGRRASSELMVLLGTFPAFLYWTFGSLETSMVSWLAVEVSIAGVAVMSKRTSALSPSLFAVSLAYLLVRPESGIILASALGVLLVIQLRRKGSSEIESQARPVATSWLIAVIAIFASLLVFRLAYFGSAMPLPVIAKTGGNPLGNIGTGIVYLSQLATRPWATALAPVIFALPYLIWRQLRKDSPDDAELFILLFIGANAAFAVISGGDWMKGARFFSHIAPVALVIGYRALCDVYDGSETSNRVSQIVAVAIAVNLAGLAAVALTNPGRPLWHFLAIDPYIRGHTGSTDYYWSERASRIHTRDILFIEDAKQLCQEIFDANGRVTVMSPQAGMVMFYLAKDFYGRVEFVDTWGLATRHLHRVRDELQLQSTRQGLKLKLGKFFARTQGLADPIFRPDIVYDIYPTASNLERNGYTVLIDNSGIDPGISVKFGSLFQYRRDLSMVQYAAVEQKLATRLGLQPRYFDWTTVLIAPPPLHR
jgi:hypothetical protein